MAMNADAPKVEIERVGDIALIRIDNPPVNAMSERVRQGLEAALNALAADPSVRALALYGAGRTFVAGADIREFGKPLTPPDPNDLIGRIENFAVPVVSILHGTVLGGGLELALGTHARVGVEGVQVGLPEVLLGLLPGAGGTQRLPRVAGVAAALDIVLSGRKVSDREALSLGIIDRLVPDAPRDAAIAMAKSVLDGSLPARRVKDLHTKPENALIEQAAEEVKRRQPNLVSPLRCIEAIAASTHPLSEGLIAERKAFLDCMNTPQRAGLVHAFFAERAVTDIPEKAAIPRPVAAIGVIGAGTMGAGIATSTLLAGFPVALVELSDEALRRGFETISANLDGAVRRGQLAAGLRDRTLGMLSLSTDLADLDRADFIVEAAFENLDVKKSIFAALDAIAKPGAIMASSTSLLNIDDIAAVTARATDVIGAHFLPPAELTRLLEIGVGARTAPEVVATAFALAKRLGKVGVRAGMSDGFIGSRIVRQSLRAAERMMIDGATPSQIDQALERFGFAMGPFRSLDLSGHNPDQAGRERKTGQGFYDPSQDPIVPHKPALQIIEEEGAKARIPPHSFTDEEIVSRYMTAMISEAARVVEKGIALRPIDVDAIFLFGYGFPRFRGGPLHYADTLGPTEILNRIERYAVEDSGFWQVPDLLRRMAERNGTFAKLNEMRQAPAERHSG